MDSDEDVDWIEIRAPAGSLGLRFGDGPRVAQAEALPSPVAAWNSTTTTENATLPTDAPGRVDGPHL